MPKTIDPALAVALAGPGELFLSRLFTFTLRTGVVYRWTDWRADLTVDGNTYAASLLANGKSFINAGGWSLTNKMVVGSLPITLALDNTPFDGGPSLKQQIQNGLFAGATVDVQYQHMAVPGRTTDFAPTHVWSGVAGSIIVVGGKATITVKAKINILDQYAPRHVYQTGCIHAFCDPGCTLNRVSFTAAYVVGASPTAMFIPWASAPVTPGVYVSGTLTMTSGAADGESMTVAAADSTGLTLVYPLSETPAPGDTFTTFQGCDKSLDNPGSVQSCTAYANTDNYDGYPFVPSPGTGY